VKSRLSTRRFARRYSTENAPQRREPRDKVPQTGEQFGTPLTLAEEIEKSIVSPGEVALSIEPSVP